MEFASAIIKWSDYGHGLTKLTGSNALSDTIIRTSDTCKIQVRLGYFFIKQQDFMCMNVSILIPNCQKVRYVHNDSIGN